MNRKIISVSKKRQITIPLQFYDHLGFDHEVECTLENGAIVLRPVNREPSEFSVEILQDLVSQGYSGDKLIQEFEKESKNIKKAITNIIKEADAIASSEKPAATFDDIFGAED